MHKNLYDEEKRAAQAALLESSREYRNARRKRNMAAFADFATNLLSLVGRNKGLRYNVESRNLSPSASRAYGVAQERYRRALIDYKGIIAAENLKNRAGENVAQGSVVLPPSIKFLKPTSHVPAQKHKPWEEKNIVDKIKDLRTPQWYKKQ